MGIELIQSLIYKLWRLPTLDYRIEARDDSLSLGPHQREIDSDVPICHEQCLTRYHRRSAMAAFCTGPARAIQITAMAAFMGFVMT
jgi:hypothetical protein